MSNKTDEPNHEAHAQDGAVDPAAPKPDKAPDDIWTNGEWAVTESGLESRHVVNGQRIPGGFGKEELLRQRPDQHGVANAALHLATKTWVNDPDKLVDALARALALHHPGQTVIDIGATREEARRAWERSRSATAADELGLDYLEGAEARFEQYRKRRQPE
jgi:hypothetical protein